MNAKALCAIMAPLLFAGAALAENEVTVDSSTLRLTLPTVIYQGNRYSAKLGFNGSCFVVEELTPKSTQVSITHDGFDFSAGTKAANWDTTDGYLTVWSTKDYPAGYAYGSGFWWSPYELSGSNDTPIQDIGKVELSSVTSIPANWTYVAGTGVYPLMVDHVYVVKARDGYGKFKVISLNGLEYANQQSNWDPTKWEVVVEYGYTSGTSF